ncbi:MAG: DUF2442 domain-containing protein [Eubacterium sp.]|nr:DUF2442 domain-containing protein [Eubacterium sp.]
MIPSVVRVEPHKDYTVTVIFDDGKSVVFDASSLVGKGVFGPLKDINTFTERCVILNDTLAWDLSGDYDTTSCLDIDPITLYEEKR